MYKIIIYNNGKRVKVIKKYNTYSNAIKKYKELLDSNVVYFPKQTLWNGVKTDYELVLTAPIKNKAKEYFRNEMGALVKIKTKGDFVIKKISSYKIEEVFKNKITDKKMTFKDLVKHFAKKRNLTCVLQVINNKLVVEYFENEDIDMFILKNCDNAYNLCETIKEFNQINNITNFIYFQEPAMDSRIRIYDILEEKYNISRVYMHKISTH
jgi:hypothetical protein